jgi:NhaP-type Na+/H+ or K+/H+ antiporter
MSHSLTVSLGLILLVASIVAIASRRMQLPYSVGLVAAGIFLAVIPIEIGVPVSPDSIFTILLPPLIFEAALQIRWVPFRRELPLILTLAFAGVVVAAVVVAVGMHLLIGCRGFRRADRGYRPGLGDRDVQGSKGRAASEPAGGGGKPAE